MKVVAALYIGLGLLLLSANCKKSTSEPMVEDPDTTSQDFIWEIRSLGDLTSSLADVFAVDEDNIWAVGEIDISDSTYNAVHWNGEQWTFQTLLAATAHGGTSPGEIDAVFAFSAEEIWMFSIAGSYVRGNGTFWESEFIPERVGSIKKIWGSSSDSIYFAGTNGNITLHDGGTWLNMESGTEVVLYDIYGNSLAEEIWTCGYASNFSESVLLRFDGTQWQTIWNNTTQDSLQPYSGLLRSLWYSDEDSLIIVGGEGVYRQHGSGELPARREDLSLPDFPNSVRGSGPNNIFIVGFNGMVLHYNGATWKHFVELENPSHVYFSVAVLEDKIVAVGADFSEGIQRDLILTGTRQ